MDNEKKIIDVFFCGVYSTGREADDMPLFCIYYCPQKNKAFSKELGFENATFNMNYSRGLTMLSQVNLEIFGETMNVTSGTDLDKWFKEEILKGEPEGTKITPWLYFMDYELYMDNLPNLTQGQFDVVPNDILTTRRLRNDINEHFKKMMRIPGDNITKETMVYLSAVAIYLFRKKGVI